MLEITYPCELRERVMPICLKYGFRPFGNEPANSYIFRTNYETKTVHGFLSSRSWQEWEEAIKVEILEKERIIDILVYGRQWEELAKAFAMDLDKKLTEEFPDTKINVKIFDFSQKEDDRWTIGDYD